MMKAFAVCLALTGTVAFAAGVNDLELWFSTSNALTAGSQTPANPVLPIGYTGKVYLWGRTHGAYQNISTTYEDVNGTHDWNYTGWVGALYQGISLNATTTIGFSGTVANPTNLSHLRWLTDGDFTWANGDQFNVAGLASERGCGGAQDPAQGQSGQSQFDNAQYVDGAYVYTRLATITISSAPAGASFFMVVGTGTIARRFGDPANDLTFFGVGDAGVHGPVVGSTSAVADMTVAPEPASLLLLGLAGLALRRR